MYGERRGDANHGFLLPDDSWHQARSCNGRRGVVSGVEVVYACAKVADEHTHAFKLHGRLSILHQRSSSAHMKWGHAGAILLDRFPLTPHLPSLYSQPQQPQAATAMPRAAPNKEKWTESHDVSIPTPLPLPLAPTHHSQRALLSAITAHLLASCRELYATPALSGVGDHGGERINKKIQAALKRMCGPEHAGLVEEEMKKLTVARRVGGGGKGSGGSSAGTSASAGKRKRVRSEDDDSG